MNGDLSCHKATLLRYAEHLARAFMRANVFYLLSALLMLIGCYIICLPNLFDYKDFKGLLTLLCVINLYEAMVIAACVFIFRRLPGSTEGATLLLVEMFFLFDATFTVNGCLVVSYAWGMLALAISLTLALVKILVLEAGAGSKLLGGIKAILIPAAVFTYTFQPMLRLGSAKPMTASGLLWLVYGALPMLLIFWRPVSEPKDGDATGDKAPLWRCGLFRELVLFLALLLPGLQLAGQTWVHRAPFSFGFLLPLVFSLLTILPLLVRKLETRHLAAVRLIVTASLLLPAAFVAGAGVESVAIFGQSLLLSEFRFSVAFAAAAYLVMWRRERRSTQLSLFCGLFTLALLGHDAASIADFFVQPEWHKIAVCVPLAFFWLYFNRAYIPALSIMTFFLLLATRCVAGTQYDFNATKEFLGYWPICALLTSLVLKHPGRGLRISLLACVFSMGAGRFSADDLPSLVYFLVAFGALLAAGTFLRRALTIYVVFAYLVAASMARFGVPMPDTSIKWGWGVIVLAFLLFIVAFLITRQHLRESMSHAPANPAERAVLTEKQ